MAEENINTTPNPEETPAGDPAGAGDEKTPEQKKQEEMDARAKKNQEIQDAEAKKGSYSSEDYPKGHIDTSDSGVDAAGFYAASPLPGFHFVLRVEGFYDIPVKSIRAFSKNNAYEHIQEGGINDYVIMKRKQVSEPFTIQVERYLSGAVTDPLANGTELLLPLLLFVNKGPKESNVGKLYVFFGCVVTGKEYGGFNAERSELATETVTIAYRQMLVIPLSNSGVDLSSTSFVENPPS